jgi:hypothetical protein
MQGSICLFVLLVVYSPFSYGMRPTLLNSHFFKPSSFAFKTSHMVKRPHSFHSLTLPPLEGFPPNTYDITHLTFPKTYKDKRYELKNPLKVISPRPLSYVKDNSLSFDDMWRTFFYENLTFEEGFALLCGHSKAIMGPQFLDLTLKSAFYAGYRLKNQDTSFIRYELQERLQALKQEALKDSEKILECLSFAIYWGNVPEMASIFNEFDAYEVKKALSDLDKSHPHAKIIPYVFQFFERENNLPFLKGLFFPQRGTKWGREKDSYLYFTRQANAGVFYENPSFRAYCVRFASLFFTHCPSG